MINEHFRTFGRQDRAAVYFLFTQPYLPRHGIPIEPPRTAYCVLGNQPAEWRIRRCCEMEKKLIHKTSLGAEFNFQVVRLSQLVRHNLQHKYEWMNTSKKNAVTRSWSKYHTINTKSIVSSFAADNHIIQRICVRKNDSRCHHPINLNLIYRKYFRVPFAQSELFQRCKFFYYYADQ